MIKILLPLLALVALASHSIGQDATESLESVLNDLVEKDIVPGIVVLVANKEKVVAVEKAGFSSLTEKAPMREDAVFWIASMSKSLTGAALMMLVDEGKVMLEDPVEKYLPEFTGQQVREADGTLHPPEHPITVREIMSHTSGLVLASEKTLKKHQDLAADVAAIAAFPLRQEPGTKYEYNNCGIDTGGRIIEVVTGMTYAEFMQTRIFDPLGMVDTTFWPDQAQADRIAHSARRGESGALEEVILDQNASPDHIAKLAKGVPVPPAMIGEMGFGISISYGKRYAMPAGGLFSTASDLGNFCRMVLNGGLHGETRMLSEAAVIAMTSSQTNGVFVNPAESYGIGWSVKIRDNEGPAPGSFGHRGARRTAMWVDPENELAMIILVERFDMTGEEQKQMYGPAMNAIIHTYGESKP